MVRAGSNPPPDHAQAFEGAHWFDVVARQAACPDLPPTVLLHAGPPLRGPAPPAVRHAAIQALCFEEPGLGVQAAGRRLDEGDIQLRPAQDFGIVTPLAQVVSAGMPLAAVRLGAHVRHGALLEGGSPALRFGATAPECRTRLDALTLLVAKWLAPAVRAAPVPLAPIIRRAVTAGDECHSRTAAANALLLAALPALEPQAAATLGASPAFILPIVMAAAAAALEHHACSISALGANGRDVGLRWRGEAHWRQMTATCPQGSVLPGLRAAPPLPAIGDSVLVDLCGLGGQVDHPDLWMALTDAGSGIIDPARIVADDTSPVFHLAMLDAAGKEGLIGRGKYRPPAALFARS